MPSLVVLQRIAVVDPEDRSFGEEVGRRNDIALSQGELEHVALAEEGVGEERKVRLSDRIEVPEGEAIESWDGGGAEELVDEVGRRVDRVESEAGKASEGPKREVAQCARAQDEVRKVKVLEGCKEQPVN